MARFLFSTVEIFLFYLFSFQTSYMAFLFQGHYCGVCSPNTPPIVFYLIPTIPFLVLFLPITYQAGKVFTFGTISPSHLFFGVFCEIFFISIPRTQNDERENRICGLKRINSMAWTCVEIISRENNLSPHLEFISEIVFPPISKREIVKYPQGGSIKAQSPNQFLFHFAFFLLGLFLFPFNNIRHFVGRVKLEKSSVDERKLR